MEDAALRWAALSDWRGWRGSGGPCRPERMGGRPTASALTGWTPRQPMRGRCRDYLRRLPVRPVPGVGLR